MNELPGEDIDNDAESFPFYTPLLSTLSHQNLNVESLKWLHDKELYSRCLRGVSKDKRPVSLVGSFKANLSDAEWTTLMANDYLTPHYHRHK